MVEQFPFKEEVLSSSLSGGTFYFMKRFYLETYGCKLNHSDSDLIRGILSKDFEEVFSADKADFIVINSCGVVERTERKIFRRIKSLKGKKVIIAGCLSVISPQTCMKMANGGIGPKNILSITEVSRAVLKGRKLFKVSDKRIDKAKYYSLKKRRKGEVSGIVVISEGCLGNCSFCGCIQRGNP